jgi:hypothetical protein
MNDAGDRPRKSTSDTDTLPFVTLSEPAAAGESKCAYPSTRFARSGRRMLCVILGGLGMKKNAIHMSAHEH